MAFDQERCAYSLRRAGELACSAELWQYGIGAYNVRRGAMWMHRYACPAILAARGKKLFYFVDEVMGERLRNTRHERFAREVAALAPLATAYREAGFGGDPRWHPYNASKLANKPGVHARIEELRVEFERMSAIQVDYVRHQLLRIVEADPRELYERDPDCPDRKRLRLRAVSDLPRHISRAISHIKIDPESGEPIEIRLADKTPAAAALLRSLPGGAVERREVSIKSGDLLDPENLAKLDDDDVEALKRVAMKLAAADASESS